MEELSRPTLGRMHVLMQLAADVLKMISANTQNRAEAQYVAGLVKDAVEYRVFPAREGTGNPGGPAEAPLGNGTPPGNTPPGRPWTEEEEEVVLKCLQEHHPRTLEGLRAAAQQLGRTFTCVKQHYYFHMKTRPKKPQPTVRPGRKQKSALLREENERLKAQLAAYDEAIKTISFYCRTGNRLVKDLFPEATENVS